MKALAIDLGGSHIRCALVEDCSIVGAASISAEAVLGLRTLLPRLTAILQKLLCQNCVSARECAGLAISFCGIVDPYRAKILSTLKKYDDGAELDLRVWSREELGLPVAIENDARMALLGERFAGAAAGFDDVVMLTLGTGIGGAAMMGGRLVRGKHFQGGCLGGHLPVVLDGRSCNCGNIGCIEAEASTWALPSICQNWPGFAESTLRRETTLNFATLYSREHDGDPVTEQIRDHCCHIWSAGTVGLIHAYDPEVVIFGGGATKTGVAFLNRIEEYARAHAWTWWGKVQVRQTMLGDDAPLLGAVPLLEELSL